MCKGCNWVWWAHSHCISGHGWWGGEEYHFSGLPDRSSTAHSISNLLAEQRVSAACIPKPGESWLHFSDLYFFLVYLKCWYFGVTALNSCHHFRFMEIQIFALAFARKKDENPLWHAIHDHSWSAVTMWGTTRLPGHQVRSGSCSQEPSLSLSVQRFWKGAGSLPDVSNYELLWWALQEEFATSSVWHGDGAVSHWPAWCKNFASCAGKEEGFPTSWVQFLAPWKPGQHGVFGFSVIGLIRSAGEVAKAAQAIVHRAGRLADPPGKSWKPMKTQHLVISINKSCASKKPWMRRGRSRRHWICRFMSQTHAVLEHCWSVRPEQLPVNTSVEASRAHKAPNLEFMVCQWFKNGISPKRACVLQGSWAR